MASYCSSSLLKAWQQKCDWTTFSGSIESKSSIRTFCNWIIPSFTRHGCLYSKGRWERGKVFNTSDVIQTIISCSANHMSRVVDHRWCQDWYPLQISNPVNTVEDEEDRGRHPECPGVNVVTEGLLVGRHRLSRTASLGLLQNRESPSVSGGGIMNILHLCNTKND